VQRRTDLIIEVTPKHARFYHDMLHFEEAGEERFNPRVCTYGVLLKLNLVYAGQQINRYGGKAESVSTRSLYAYAMSPIEQQAILRGVMASHDRLAEAA
jgi:N-acyl amino acid synthase FeeM